MMTITPIIYMMSLVRLSDSYIIGTSNISNIDINTIQLFNIGSLIYNIDFILFLIADIIIFIQLLIIRKDN